MQQHLKEVGDEIDKIVAQGIEPKAEAASASSVTASAASAAAVDDVPSSSDVLLSTKQVSRLDAKLSTATFCLIYRYSSTIGRCQAIVGC